MIQIHHLTPTEIEQFSELLHLFNEAFELDDRSLVPPAHLQKLLARPEFHVFVAIQNERVVGGLTAYEIEQYYSTKPLAYIYDIAVDTKLQRQGIGQQLLSVCQAWFQERGFEEVFVQADKEDQHAIDFYNASKPSAGDDVMHFTFRL